LAPEIEFHGEPERLPGVEIRHLAALAAVAGEGSLKGAARRLGYVPSAVSQQLRELEQAVDTLLVERSPGASQVRLTDPGRLLLGHAESILARVMAARADIAALGGRPRLRVGLDAVVATRLVPEIVDALGVEAALRISLDDYADDNHLLDELRCGRLDLAFADLPLADGPYAYVELLSDPCVLLVPSSSPLAERPQPPSLPEIARMPLILRSCSRFQRRVEAALAVHGGPVGITQRVASDASVRALVAAGVGVAILPHLSVDTADPDTLAMELADALPPRTLVLAWNRERRLRADAVRFRDAAGRASERVERERLVLSWRHQSG
jgi:DNA-binding transcriptional LysR family regulator